MLRVKGLLPEAHKAAGVGLSGDNCLEWDEIEDGAQKRHTTATYPAKPGNNRVGGLQCTSAM
jgi:hypothetical protein